MQQNAQKTIPYEDEPIWAFKAYWKQKTQGPLGLHDLSEMTEADITLYTRKLKVWNLPVFLEVNGSSQIPTDAFGVM